MTARGSRFGATGRFALGLVLIVGAIPAALGFARGLSEGRRPGQSWPPSVELLTEDRAAVEDAPSYLQAIPVLTFHDVDNRSTSEYAVTERRFAEHMAALDAAGFHTVSIEQVADLVAGRDPVLPPRPILITFDDGTAGTWRYADPILASHGFRAVAFVVTSAVSPDDAAQSYYLTWNEIRKMAASGRWDIEGHTHNGHREVPTASGPSPFLSNRIVEPDGETETLAAWRQRIADDLHTNREQLEQHVYQPVRALAYPFSASRFPSNDPTIGDPLPGVVRETFELAFTNEAEPAAVVAGSDPLLLPRLGSITADVTPAELMRRIARAVPQPIPANPTQLTWVEHGPGTCTSQAGAVSVSSPAGVFSRCAPEVEHTDLWRDYSFSTDVVANQPGSTSFVIVRDSERGRVEVSLDSSSLKVRQLVDDKWALLAAHDLSPPAGEVRRVDLAVGGSKLVVSVDGEPVDTVPIDPALTDGLIGVGTVAQADSTAHFQGMRLTPR